MNLKITSRIIFLFLAALILWILLSSASLVWAVPETYLVAFALMAFTATIILIQPFKHSGWLAAFLSILVYTLILGSLLGFTIAIILPALLFAVLTLVTAMLCHLLIKEVTQLYQQIHQQQRLVEELRIYDPTTGLLRNPHMLNSLRNEIIRSQRYSKTLCVLLMDIENAKQIQEELGQAGLDSARKQVAEVLVTCLRSIDIAFGGERIGAILPETTPEGAMVVISRILNLASTKSRLSLSIGVSHFPEDGVSESDLLQAAEVALQLSRSTARPIVFYSQINSAVKQP